ncbi:MAG: ATP-binding protein [Candidatus Obscuribacterales bacterium]|nr:ATP-binding protein [Candidatus Obscuribacterales bacterium]
MSLLLDPSVIVLTGGPCVGKTTLIKALAELGYLVAEEEAARLIKEGKLSVVNHWQEFQLELLRRQEASETELLKQGKPIFADRGLFDNVAYWKHKGKRPDNLPQMLGPRYSLAFLLEPLNIWVDDGVRSEDLQFCREITPMFEAAYTEVGVRVVRVPAVSVEERIALILKEAQPYLQKT